MQKRTQKRTHTHTRARHAHTTHHAHSHTQAVQEFIDYKIHYLDIMKLVEQCCEAHKADLVAAPSLDDIVHYDQWARKWVAERVSSGKFVPTQSVAVGAAAA